MSSHRETVIRALGDHFGITHMPNPDFDRRAERTAHRAGQDYGVPLMVPITLEILEERSPWITTIAADGGPSTRCATLGEIADALIAEKSEAAVREGELARSILHKIMNDGDVAIGYPVPGRVGHLLEIYDSAVALTPDEVALLCSMIGEEP